MKKSQKYWLLGLSAAGLSLVGLAIYVSRASGKTLGKAFGQRLSPRPGRAVAIGDSITAHGGYLRTLQQGLPGYQWENAGVVGNSTGQMLTRARSLLSGPGRYTDVIIAGDLNDGDRSASYTVSNIRQMATRAKNTGHRVILVSSTPWRGYARWNQRGQDRQDEVRRWLLSGAEGLADVVVDGYRPLEDPNRPTYLNPLYAANDRLHLNRIGQTKLGQEILRQAYGIQ
jgi:lysophospholipase L1-like esterase